MKAGIMTFHRADNYGAVLQAYALQKTLTGLGVDSDFLEFEEPDRKKEQEVADRKGPPAFVERLRREGKARTALFDAFRARHLRCSAPLAPERAGELNGRYDVFLAGSDQIWNLRLPEADERYFLPFAAPEKRVSYAASFGMEEIPDELKDWYAQRLAGFRALSVREERGRELVRELTGREDCAVCLDPVLLLDRGDWEEIAAPCGGEPYLFLYMVGYDGQLAARAKGEAEKRGLALRAAMGGFIPQYGFSAWSGVGVEQWLSLIRGSEGVFTNSFHCTAFAMLFGRPVMTALLGDGLAQRNGRLEELLRLGGAERRGEPAEVPAEDFALRIRDRRRESLDYLRETLGQDSAG